jgi:hypothetical protein
MLNKWVSVASQTVPLIGFYIGNRVGENNIHYLFKKHRKCDVCMASIVANSSCAFPPSMEVSAGGRTAQETKSRNEAISMLTLPH